MLDPCAQTPGYQCHQSRWVFKIKRTKEGTLDRYKAGWVACGFTQVEGVDYNNTYVSVAKPVSVWTMMTMVAQYDLECKQLEIVTAFLHSMIKDQKIYVKQPHGFNNNTTEVCLLKRPCTASSSLHFYGTRSLQHSFNPLNSHPCGAMHVSS